MPAAELVLVVWHPAYAILPWSIIAAIGAGAALTYAILPTYYPLSMSARANSLLNIFTTGGAFVVQLALGYIISHWSRDQFGHYPTIACDTALIALSIAQTVALLRFVFGIPKHKLHAIRNIRSVHVDAKQQVRLLKQPHAAEARTTQ